MIDAQKVFTGLTLQEKKTRERILSAWAPYFGESSVYTHRGGWPFLPVEDRPIVQSLAYDLTPAQLRLFSLAPDGVDPKDFKEFIISWCKDKDYTLPVSVWTKNGANVAQTVRLAESLNVRCAQKAEAFVNRALAGDVLHPDDADWYVKLVLDRYSPLFFRPCPAIPDAGAAVGGAESRKVTDHAEVFDDLKQMAALPLVSDKRRNGDVVVRVTSAVCADYINARLSAVAAYYEGESVGQMSIGLRHDGVTAGGPSVSLPIRIRPSVLHGALSLDVATNNLELEVVTKGLSKTEIYNARPSQQVNHTIVQYRRAPAHPRPSKVAGTKLFQGFGGIGSDYVLLDATTLPALDVSTDVIKRLDNPTKAVLCQGEGSLLSHASAQARALQCSFAVASPTDVAEAVNAHGHLSDLGGFIGIPETEGSTDMSSDLSNVDKFFEGFDFGSKYPFCDAASLTACFHSWMGNHPTVDDDTAFFAGVGAATLTHFAALAVMGELRHARGRQCLHLMANSGAAMQAVAMISPKASGSRSATWVAVRRSLQRMTATRPDLSAKVFERVKVAFEHSMWAYENSFSIGERASSAQCRFDLAVTSNAFGYAGTKEEDGYSTVEFRLKPNTSAKLPGVSKSVHPNFAYGGPNWANAADLISRVYASRAKEDVYALADAFNLLEHAVHNGGMVLDKFGFNSSILDDYTQGFVIENSCSRAFSAARAMFALRSLGYGTPLSEKDKEYVDANFSPYVSRYTQDTSAHFHPQAEAILDRAAEFRDLPHHMIDVMQNGKLNTADCADYRFAFSMYGYCDTHKPYLGKRCSHNQFCKATEKSNVQHNLPYHIQSVIAAVRKQAMIIAKKKTNK